MVGDGWGEDLAKSSRFLGYTSSPTAHPNPVSSIKNEGVRGQARFMYICSLGWVGWGIVAVAERAVEAVAV